jgi:uroporphyrinogen decarboxylase
MTTSEMTGKERVRRALRRQEPDRVPAFITLKVDLGRKMAGVLGYPLKPANSSFENRLSYHDMLTALGNDAVGVGYCMAPVVELPDGCVRDEWGLTYGVVPNLYASNREIVGRPLADIGSSRDLARYRFPDPFSPGRFDLAEEMVRTYGDRCALVGVIECTVFEWAWYLVGMEKFLMALATGEDYVEPLLDEVMNFNIAVGRRLVELGIDVILTGDDMGSQVGMMISPALWRRYFKERMRHVFGKLKAANPDLILAYHSCGSIVPIIPDLIEIGLDVLNPVQPNAAGMAPAALKNTFGDRVAFFGGLDTQGAIPFGTVDDVRAEVRLRILELGGGGGYMVGPAHDIQPEAPIENVLAIFDAIREFGSYPLR